MRMMPSWACPLILVTSAVTVLFFAGCDDDSSKPAPDPLSCSIFADPATGTAPVDIAFSAEVTSGQTPYSFEWGFGDGASSTQQGPVHRYEAEGTYTVALTVSDAGGATAEDELELVIEPAVFSCTAIANPASGTAPLRVNFTSEVTGGESPYMYVWNFDDGLTSNQQNPVHDFATEGLYEVSLTVQSGQESCDCMVEVNVEPAVFSCNAIADPSSGPAPLQVRFTGEVTGGTPPLSFTWDFGDGSATSQQQNPVHDYGWAGVFEAKLTVTGAADQCECWVTVEVQ